MKDFKSMRDSRLELLRIFAMLLIVASHSVGYCKSANCLFDECLLNILKIGGGLGVNLFVLISGYFLIESEKAPRRVLNLLYTLCCYTAILTICRYFFDNDISLVNAFLKVGQGQYWFINAYVVLLFLSPYLNICMRKMGKSTHQKLILSLLLVSIILPFYLRFSTGLGSFGIFPLLYCTAAYVRIYGLDFKYSNIIALFTVLIAIGIASCLVFLTWLCATYNMDCYGRYYMMLAGRHSFPIYLLSLLLFLCMLRFTSYRQPAINCIASGTLGVYLFHEHPYMREFLWKDCFSVHQVADGNLLLKLCIAVFGIFTCGILFDILYRNTLHRIFPLLMKVIIDPICMFVRGFYVRLKAYLK